MDCKEFRRVFWEEDPMAVTAQVRQVWANHRDTCRDCHQFMEEQGERLKKEAPPFIDVIAQILARSQFEKDLEEIGEKPKESSSER